MRLNDPDIACGSVEINHIRRINCCLPYKCCSHEEQAVNADYAARVAETEAAQARAHEAAIHAMLTEAMKRTFKANAKAYKLRQADRLREKADRRDARD